MPNAQCPMAYALCPMPNALCPMPNAQCPMPYALCPMAYALCPMPYALCPMPYALCPVVPHLSKKGYINYFSIFFTAVKSACKLWETSDKFRNAFSRSPAIFRAVSQVKVKE